MQSRRSKMSDATLLIKKMPSDLKDWLAAEAQRNHRSMNKETIRLLEEARSLRDKADKPARDKQSIAGILQAMHALPVLDARPMAEVLYDASGLPQ
ncbi:MAG: Arc family DNA-binding protein [Betaproteobacteria bacterium]|nr:Arc family DNA-binding protein [Betaproteobacteria bacterium]